MIDKIKNYLKETVAEMKKVAWPDKKYITAATIIVLIIIIAMGIFIVLVDLGFARFFKLFTK